MFNYKTGEGEADSEKYRKKKEKLDSFHHWGLGSIDSDSLSTLVQKWEQLWVPECDMAWNTAEACVWETESPPMLPLKSLLPSFGQKHQQEKVLTCTYYGIQALEVFYWTVAWKVTVFHGCCTVAVKIHRLLSICHFFFFFLFLSLPLPSHLNWLGDKNPAGYTWLALKLISELLQKWLENRSGLTWISLQWGTA